MGGGKRLVDPGHRARQGTSDAWAAWAADAREAPEHAGSEEERCREDDGAGHNAPPSPSRAIILRE
ncbi:hypothetical protein ACFPRL_28945 [Pseudoclavibacter helvolus]